MVDEKIFRCYSNSFLIFTDGSKLENGNLGCAFHIPSLKITKQYRLNDNISVFSAEMSAILMALSYLIDFPHTINDVVIMSDSKSALQALICPGKSRKGMIIEIQMIVNQLKLRGCFVRFQWVPSHVGVIGNVVADRAAKEGANLPYITLDVHMTVNEASALIKNVIREEWKDQYESLASNRNWIEPSISCKGTFPSLQRGLAPLFYRLRGKTYKTQYTTQRCFCNDSLSYDHIFSCPLILDLMKDNGYLKQQELNKYSLLRKHKLFNWKITLYFLRVLYNSDIGHLL